VRGRTRLTFWHYDILGLSGRSRGGGIQGCVDYKNPVQSQPQGNSCFMNGSGAVLV
jgi:hypothetical protein